MMYNLEKAKTAATPRTRIDVKEMERIMASSPLTRGEAMKLRSAAMRLAHLALDRPGVSERQGFGSSHEQTL